MIINCDFDGVIYPNSKMFKKYLSEEHGMDPDLIEIDTYDKYFDEVGAGLKDISDKIFKCRKDIVLDFEPIKESKRSLEKLMNEGHKVNIVTHRPDYIEETTLDWIERENVPYDDIYFDSPRDKSKIEADVMIDDAPYVANYFENSEQDFILFPRLYNSDVDDDFIINPYDRHGYSLETILKEGYQWKVILKVLRDLVDSGEID